MTNIYKRLYTRNFNKVSDVVDLLEKSKLDFEPQDKAYEVLTLAIIELKNIQITSDEYLMEFDEEGPKESEELDGEDETAQSNEQTVESPLPDANNTEG